MPPQGILATITSIIFINRGFPILFIKAIKGGFRLPRFLVFLVFLKLLASENYRIFCHSSVQKVIVVFFAICCDDQWQLEHVLSATVVGQKISEVLLAIWVEMFGDLNGQHPLVNVEIFNPARINAGIIHNPSARDDVVVRCHVVSISHAPRDARVFSIVFVFFDVAIRVTPCAMLHHATLTIRKINEIKRKYLLRSAWRVV